MIIWQLHHSRPILWLALAAALVGLLSCGKPSRPPTDQAEIPGYLQLREEVGDHDFAPLRARRIVIDPGHGGYFKGAVGDQGLTEAEVNLGVALYLRGLLEWADAEVYLTRTADYDFLTPADSTLASDLAARVAFADSLQPDVFLSIHHNSTAQRDPDINETQTYYPVGRDGPDLDLARTIHKHLVINLEISPAKILPGNFRVLRDATVPAVLGEPAMISNPVMEGRLSLARSHELEASAYFLGLLEYFAAGTPRFESGFGDTVTIHDIAGGPLTWSFAADTRHASGTAGASGAPGLDPGSIVLRVDGAVEAVAISADGRRVQWSRPRQHGVHELELVARNLAGRSTPLLRQIWIGWAAEVHHTFLWEEASTSGTAGNEAGRRTLFGWELAAVGPPALQPSRELWLGGASGADEPAGLPLPLFPGRQGWILLDPVDFPDPAFIGQPAGGAHTSAGMHLDEPVPLVDLAPIQPARLTLPPGWRWRVLWPRGETWAGQVVPGGAWNPRWLPQAADLTPLLALAPVFDPAAPVLAAKEGTPFWLEATGALPICADADHRLPWQEPGGAAPDTLFWEPLLPPLVGKVIVLDARGGGAESDGTGPLGTRGSDLNLQIVEKTAALLRGAGCEVVLTRDGESRVPREQKILLANRAGAEQGGADLFLTIQRSDNPAGRVVARHHAGSSRGSAWARLFARAVQPLLAVGDTALVEPSWAYLLRHTASPALQVSLPGPDDIATEEELNDPPRQQAIARALLLGIAALWVGEEVIDDSLDLVDLLQAAPPTMLPLDRLDWARLDGNFFWQPVAAGRQGTAVAAPALSYLETPGLPALGPHHTVELHAGGSWQLWALSLRPDGASAYELLLENR